MLIICNGMFRSGSTLQYNLVRHLVERTGAGMAHGFFDQDKLVEESASLTEYAFDDKNLHVIKVHDVPKIVDDKSCQDKVKVIYIFRDLRDVAVSIKQFGGFDDCLSNRLIEILDDAVETFHHIRQISNPLIQRYEILMSDKMGGLESISDFLSVSANRDELESIVLSCSMKNMKRSSYRARMYKKILESRLGPILKRLNIIKKTYDSQTLLHGNHISSTQGKSVWREILTSDEVEFIVDRYRDWFEETGYQIDGSNSRQGAASI